MQPETIRYLIEITIARRDMCAAQALNPAHSPKTAAHWQSELQRANTAYAELSRMPIA